MSEQELFDLAVIGAGPGGYSCAFRAADLGLKVALIERYPALGGVCLNVGCIPSKTLLHAASLIRESREIAAYGVNFSNLTVDLQKLRDKKNSVISKLNQGLAAMARQRKVTVITGVAEFNNQNSLKIKTDNDEQILNFKKCVIAAGSSAVKLPFLPDDPRIIDSTAALALNDIPKKMLVIGAGIIGLEMATVYQALGAEIDIVEMQNGVMLGADRDVARIWQKKNANDFKIMTSTTTISATAEADGIYVQLQTEGEEDEKIIRYDRVLVAVGRSPNGKKLNLDAANVHYNERGFIPVDKQMRTNQPHIFAIGDIVGQPMLAHKATHEAQIAAEVAAGRKAFFDARVIPSVAFTAPEAAWVGLTEDEANKQHINYKKASFPWSASGRAIANACEEGFAKLIFDAETGRILGGAIVVGSAGDFIGEIALAIEMGATAEDIALTIHPHPTLGESIGLAAEVFLGSCVDLPPQKR